MSWMIVLPAGVIVGILFSSAFPDMASGINEALSPQLYALGDLLVDRIRDAASSILN
ncbi:hypothetical protein NsoK4_06930 [Nitrosopumilus sp. K4]|uniref:hypothetical protein n=1 Tax=Nitrosopumilus sp. K4 TaxID=2795383 RepID=UPI001BA9700C|nr:hypothetical protein [Nitrosopumilus sp. K4]QUC64173.1 hypothetical protein NsoK4_06930 [Nitrosopumilus sp. K4]